MKGCELRWGIGGAVGRRAGWGHRSAFGAFNGLL